MEIEAMYEIQRKVDAQLFEKHGCLKFQMVPAKVLALQIALGELGRDAGFANPFDHKLVHNGCLKCLFKHGEHVCSIPILDTLVKCWELILGFGIEKWDEITVKKCVPTKDEDETSPFEWFLEVNQLVAILYRVTGQDLVDVYQHLVGGFLLLVELLGFEGEDLEAAYFKKHGGGVPSV